MMDLGLCGIFFSLWYQWSVE